MAVSRIEEKLLVWLIAMNSYSKNIRRKTMNYKDGCPAMTSLSGATFWHWKYHKQSLQNLECGKLR